MIPQHHQKCLEGNDANTFIRVKVQKVLVIRHEKSTPMRTAAASMASSFASRGTRWRDEPTLINLESLAICLRTSRAVLADRPSFSMSTRSTSSSR